MNNFIQIYSSIKREQKPIGQFIDFQKILFLFNNFKRYEAKKKSLLIILFCIFIYFFFKVKEFFFFNFSFIIIFLFSFLIWQISKNICSTFSFSKIYYEESSWFDIKIWQKPIFLIKNDKIFYRFKGKKLSRYFSKMFFYLAIEFLLFFFFQNI